MNEITEKLLAEVSDYKGEFKGAYNIREDSGCVARQSSKHIKITAKKDKPGIDIHISCKDEQETVYIPACVTHSGVHDVVYNDFIVEDGADVIIVAGCGVHSDGAEEASHNGIHRFLIGKGAKVVYKEKHIGTGKGTGERNIDPITEVEMAEDSYLEMDTMQISGVSESLKKSL